MPKPVVIIENPSVCGSRFTSFRAAERYIAKGRARWSGKLKLRFIEDDYRNLSATETSLAKNRGYDARGILTLDEIQNLPCVKPTLLITIPKKCRIAPRRNGKVKVLFPQAA